MYQNPQGVTVINGSNITTGSINAQMITTNKLVASQISGVNANVIASASNNKAGTLWVTDLKPQNIDFTGYESGKEINGAILIDTNRLAIEGSHPNNYIYFTSYDRPGETGKKKYMLTPLGVYNQDSLSDGKSWSDIIAGGGGGGSGTVTSITAGTGLSGGTITTSGTISLDTTGASTGQVLVKTSSGVGWSNPVAVFG